MQQTDNTSSLGQRAAGDLSLIRMLMQRATLIVPMSGWSLFWIGALGLIASGASVGLDVSGLGWVVLWVITAALASTLALLTSVVQLRSKGHSILTGSHTRFWLSLIPGFIAAAAISMVLLQAEMVTRLPGLWLLLYGVSILAAGTQCIALISRMGLTFLLLGAVALFLPWPNLSMAIGFGLTHMLYGLLIARYNHE